MKKYCYLMVISTFILSSMPVFAVGLGVYGTGGTSSTRWNASNKEEKRTTDYSYGCGFILDTHPARNELFGYRLKAGYEQYASIGYGNVSTGASISKINMLVTLGFGVIRNEKMRFWIGPRIGLGYLFGEKNFWNYSGYLDLSAFPFVKIFPYKDKIKYEYLSGSIGLELGANFHIGDYVSIFIDCGFGYGVHIATNTRQPSISLTNPLGGIFGTRKTLVGNGIGIQGGAGVLFRIFDKYEEVR